jgi:antitoxin ParD1/3/4
MAMTPYRRTSNKVTPECDEGGYGTGLESPSRNTNHWYSGLVGKNTSFSLDEHYSAFIDGEVAAGRYRSASDVVRSALRLLEDRETQLRALREALDAGERSGTSTPFDFDAFLGRKRAEESRGR